MRLARPPPPAASRPARAAAVAAALAAATLACAALGCAAPAREGRPGDGASPAGSPGTDGEVRLTFAWPPDLRLRVALDHREWRGREERRARYAHRVVVAPEGRWLRVSVRDAEAEGDTPGLELNLALNETLDQVVAADGSYVRTEGLERALELLGADDEEARATSRQALERVAELDWELLVGAWADRALRPGRPEPRAFPGAVPLLPSVPALLDVEATLAGRVACEEGEAAAACVELVWRASPGPRARAAAVERLLGSREAGAPPLDVEGLQASAEARLVTEPDTLVPHRLTVREELRLAVRQPGGDVEEVVDRSEDRYRFARETEL
jgi:hypothetical protein